MPKVTLTYTCMDHVHCILKANCVKCHTPGPALQADMMYTRPVTVSVTDTRPVTGPCPPNTPTVHHVLVVHVAVSVRECISFTAEQSAHFLNYM